MNKKSLVYNQDLLLAPPPIALSLKSPRSCFPKKSLFRFSLILAPLLLAPLSSVKAANFGVNGCSSTSSTACVGGTYFGNGINASLSDTLDTTPDKKALKVTGKFYDPSQYFTLNSNKSVVSANNIVVDNGSRAEFNFKNSAYMGNYTIELNGGYNSTTSFKFDGNYQGTSDANAKGYAYVGNITGNNQTFRATFNNDANMKGNFAFNNPITYISTNIVNFTNSSLEGDITKDKTKLFTGNKSNATITFSGNSSKGFAMKGNIRNGFQDMTVNFNNQAKMVGNLMANSDITRAAPTTNINFNNAYLDGNINLNGHGGTFNLSAKAGSKLNTNLTGTNGGYNDNFNITLDNSILQGRTEGSRASYTNTNDFFKLTATGNSKILMNFTAGPRSRHDIPSPTNTISLSDSSWNGNITITPNESVNLTLKNSTMDGNISGNGIFKGSFTTSSLGNITNNNASSTLNFSLGSATTSGKLDDHTIGNIIFSGQMSGSIINTTMGDIRLTSGSSISNNLNLKDSFLKWVSLDSGAKLRFTSTGSTIGAVGNLGSAINNNWGSFDATFEGTTINGNIVWGDANFANSVDKDKGLYFKNKSTLNGDIVAPTKGNFETNNTFSFDDSVMKGNIILNKKTNGLENTINANFTAGSVFQGDISGNSIINAMFDNSNIKSNQISNSNTASRLTFKTIKDSTIEKIDFTGVISGDLSHSNIGNLTNTNTTSSLTLTNTKDDTPLIPSTDGTPAPINVLGDVRFAGTLNVDYHNSITNSFNVSGNTNLSYSDGSKIGTLNVNGGTTHLTLSNQSYLSALNVTGGDSTVNLKSGSLILSTIGISAENAISTVSFSSSVNGSDGVDFTRSNQMIAQKIQDLIQAQAQAKLEAEAQAKLEAEAKLEAQADKKDSIDSVSSLASSGDTSMAKAETPAEAPVVSNVPVMALALLSEEIPADRAPATDTAPAPSEISPTPSESAPTSTDTTLQSVPELTAPDLPVTPVDGTPTDGTSDTSSDGMALDDTSSSTTNPDSMPSTDGDIVAPADIKPVAIPASPISPADTDMVPSDGSLTPEQLAFLLKNLTPQDALSYLSMAKISSYAGDINTKAGSHNVNFVDSLYLGGNINTTGGTANITMSFSEAFIQKLQENPITKALLYGGDGPKFVVTTNGQNAVNNIALSGSVKGEAEVNYLQGKTNIIFADNIKAPSDGSNTTFKAGDTTDFSDKEIFNPNSTDESKKVAKINGYEYENGIYVDLDAAKADTILSNYRELFPINTTTFKIDKVSNPNIYTATIYGAMVGEVSSLAHSIGEDVKSYQAIFAKDALFIGKLNILDRNVSIDLSQGSKLILEDGSNISVLSSSDTSKSFVLETKNITGDSIYQSNTIVDLATGGNPSSSSRIKNSYGVLNIGEVRNLNNALFRVSYNPFAKADDEAINKNDHIIINSAISGNQTNYLQAYQNTLEPVLGNLSDKNILVLSIKNDFARPDGSKTAGLSFNTKSSVLQGYDLIETIFDKRVENSSGGNVSVPNSDATSGADGATSSSDTWTNYYIAQAQSQITQHSKDLTRAAISSNYAIFLANINDLNKRLGELRDNPNAQGVWARVFSGLNTSNRGEEVKSYSTNVQVGYDVSIANSSLDGKNYLGFALSYGYNKLGSQSFNGKANLMEVGAYYSYVGNTGFYNDTILKYAYIDNDLTLQNNEKSNTSFSSSTASLGEELGYRFYFDIKETRSSKHSLYLEPNAEVVIGYVGNGGFDQINGNAFLNAAIDNILAFRGKAGGVLGYSLKTAGNQTDFRLGLSYVADIVTGGNMKFKTNFSNAQLELESNQMAMVSVGVNSILSDAWKVYADVDTSFGGKYYNQNYLVSVGGRYAFGKKTEFAQKTKSSTPAESAKKTPIKEGYYFDVYTLQKNAKLTSFEMEILSKYPYVISLEKVTSIDPKTKASKTIEVQKILIGPFKTKEGAQQSQKIANEISKKLGNKETKALLKEVK